MKIVKLLAEVYRYSVSPKIKTLRLDMVVWGLMYPGLLLVAVLFDLLGRDARKAKIGILLSLSIVCAIAIYVGAFCLVIGVL